MKKIILFVCLMFGVAPNSIDAVNNPARRYEGARVQQSESTVYVTRAGKKFHKSTCFHISNKQTTSMSRSSALKKGYEACKHCKP